jgi:tRNA(Arg) A34 adenosine deaminase TadA
MSEEKGAEHEVCMRLALEQAALAQAQGEVPVGAVVVEGGVVIGRATTSRSLPATPRLTPRSWHCVRRRVPPRTIA